MFFPPFGGFFHVDFTEYSNIQADKNKKTIHTICMIIPRFLRHFKFFYRTAIALAMFLTITVGFTSLLNISVNAQQAEAIVEYQEEIRADRKDPIYLKFPYGSIYNEQDIRNSSLKVEVIGKGFEINKSETYDQYYTEIVEQDGQKYPKRYQCQGEFTGKGFLLSSSLVSLTGITQYGPQTSKDSEKASGAESTTLQARHTGCLVVSLQVRKDAKPGDLARIIFNQNVLNSTDYGSRTKPGLQTIQLKIASDESCSNNEEFALGSCKKICEKNELRNVENGNCEIVQLICNKGAEIFNNQCVDKCLTAQQRDLSGRCVVPNGYVCENGVCTNSNACSGYACSTEANQIKLGQTETRILIMLIITIIIAIVVVVLIFVLRRIRTFQKLREPRTPHDNYPPDQF